MVWLILYLLLLLLKIVFVLSLIFVFTLLFSKQSYEKRKSEKLQVAFLHHNSLRGGGAEKVLFGCIYSLLKQYQENIEIRIFDCGVNTNSIQLKKLLIDQFGLTIENLKPVKFVNIYSLCLLRPYKYCSAPINMLGSLIVYLECSVICNLFNFSIVLDTNMACFISWGHFLTKFTLSKIYKMNRSKIKSAFVSYVHFPVMEYNESFVSGRKMHLSKKLYQKSVLYIYYKTLKYTIDKVRVNSHWTKDEIVRLMSVFTTKTDFNMVTIFPPCNTDNFENVNNKSFKNSSKIKLVSFGHLRRHKNHTLQLDILKRILELGHDNVKLTIFGSLIGEKHNLVFYELCLKIIELRLEKHVKFKLNKSWKEIKNYMAKKDVLIGIHTNKEERFGIAQVEMSCAGLIVLGFKSGGAYADIFPQNQRHLKPQHELLCENADDFVRNILLVAKYDDEQYRSVVDSAKKHLVENFSLECFEYRFSAEMDKILRFFS